MKTKDIKNEVVKQVIKTALQNKIAVTIANVFDKSIIVTDPETKTK